MIRRNVTIEVGQPAWLLISQVEHARLSGELAEHWGAESGQDVSFLPLVARKELLPAIYHHDDGWQQWEQAPQVDFQTGRPLTFTEMPLAVALEIWRKSINRAIQIGPLAAWAVASHFTALLRHSQDSQEPLATIWLEQYDHWRDEWLGQWTCQNPAQNTSQQADIALKQLQFFDRLSLWLCITERTAPEQFETPDGTSLTITPQANRNVLTVHPWPLEVNQLELSVAGRLVTVRAYSNSQTLAEVPLATQTLVWRLIPD